MRFNAQFKRRDVAAEVDNISDSRAATAAGLIAGDTSATTLSDEGVPVGDLRSKFTVFREMMKVIISFGQVISSFANV